MLLDGVPNILTPGARIIHPDFGSGVVIESNHDGYLRAFFSVGERRVPLSTARLLLTRSDLMVRGLEEGAQRQRMAWLSYEAHVIPIMESASALTSAKIDLLPHQVVLTHRLASSSPRRFLIADEVGLGKTIEMALVLRELVSRGELKRALIIVPAGLVNNWHRELNEVFHLDFEVFGSEGDITDRKTNAFAKHDRLIASMDTLKRPVRIKRLLDAPSWDLVVFDEAHHLSAHLSGGKLHKTDNFKLAEALRNHTRDLILLSATPHQGNHHRFWMLIGLLNPTLFSSPKDMVDNRHRLNSVIYRRTKADACRPNGDPLFARRQVHTESFLMTEEEQLNYEQLRNYLQDGFDLAKRQGHQGRGLGFLMTIFQKIAASSFAAVRRTLRRRLLMLTIHESLLRDKQLDIEGREKLQEEARTLIFDDYGLDRDLLGQTEAERILAEMKYRLAKKMDEDSLIMAADPYACEFAAIQGEEAATTVVNIHLPEERLRIQELLNSFPRQRETKIQKLLDGLSTLWRNNPNEKIVIFATYLGTVDLLAREIEQAFPGQGVVVLRGGDHGAKLAAQRRFSQKQGPRVMVCTAAGREGINLQFARILFNFDLPWNPMDVEQRIGRIHRYGQNHTAQVYNLILSDTIEGRIYLLLDDKLTEIARTLGKLDQHGNMAEDFRSQILGQLSERLNYDRLYQEALGDPELKRTQLELEAALSNAREARKVVFDLFQDLKGFSLEEYQPFADISNGLERMVRFMAESVTDSQQRLIKVDDETYDLAVKEGKSSIRFTLNRETATNQDTIELMGLDHPLVQNELLRWRNAPPEKIGIAVDGEGQETALLSFWLVEISTGKGERRALVQPVAVNTMGMRLPAVERQGEHYFKSKPAQAKLSLYERKELLEGAVEAILHRELKHSGAADGEGSYTAELIGLVEIC